MPFKILPLVNEAKGMFASFLPLTVGFIPTDETMALLKLIAIGLSIICSSLGISWWVYRFIKKK